MQDPQWDNVDEERTAAGWYQLFSSDDFRSTVKWKARFAGIKNAVNCYSRTDDVVKNVERTKWNSLFEDLDVMGSTWGLQERKKGTRLIKLASIVLSHTRIETEAGWGLNTSLFGANKILPASVNDRKVVELIKRPLFCPFMHEPEKLMSTNLFPLAKNDFDSYQYDLRSVLLADGIPATSFAMGANTISAMKNIDMAELEGAGWPRKDKEWHHSDIKNVAYYYEKRFFDKLVKGEDK